MRNIPRLPIVLAFALLLAWAAPAADDSGDSQARIARLRAEMDAAMEEQSRALLTEASDKQERADVALALGAIYGMGLMGEADLVKASAFYSLASELESAEADCALAELYSVGAESRSGRIAKDMDMALEYYRRAAVGGSVKAMLALGAMYMNGAPGVERNTKKALTYLMDAATRGNKEALALLDPVIQNAKQWEERNPGKKAGFPTSQEQIVKLELAKEDFVRSDHLDKTASHVYVELSKRVAAATKKQ